MSHTASKPSTNYRIAPGLDETMEELSRCDRQTYDLQSVHCLLSRHGAVATAMQCRPGADGVRLPSPKTTARLAPYNQVNRNHGILAACLAGSTLSAFTGPRHKM